MRVCVCSGEQGMLDDEASKTSAGRERLNIHSAQWYIGYAVVSNEGV